jgi:hypothetical protein
MLLIKPVYYLSKKFTLPFNAVMFGFVLIPFLFGCYLELNDRD